MDLLTLMSKLENSEMVRNAEHIQTFNGFEEKDTVTWTGDVTLKINSDDAVADVWKCFMVEDLSGVWWFVYCRVLNNKVVFDEVKLVDISTLTIS